jgi:hypothetical protein
MSAALSKLTEPEEASQGSGSFRPERLCVLREEARPTTLTGDRLLAFEALRLMMRLDRDLLEARAQWNQDWFRRLMHARSKVVLRVQRRWDKVDPAPAIPLGSLVRRYHANLAEYLYQPRI